VLRELEDGPGTLSEIVEGAGGHRSTVRRVLERAVADGLVNAAGRRESLNGRTAVIFALAGDDE
jgi:predicted ArsR family transcriptional regulator